jgi:hypothetical protein
MGGYSSSDDSSSRDYNFSDDVKVTQRSAASYAKDDNREYVAPSKGLPPPVGMELSTSSRLSALILLDQTGSMREAPKYIIDKMPTLYAESNAAIQGKKLSELQAGEKLEDELEIAAIAIGDARNNESCPLQAIDYAKSGKLVKDILKIYPEGNGGGNKKESYDLGLYFALKHTNAPTPTKEEAKPLLVIIGDEGFYDDIRKEEIKRYTGDVLDEDLETKDVIKKLTKKFDVYMLRPEIGGYDASDYSKIQEQWQEVLGNERVLKIKGEYKRIVDCIIGICGFAADNFAEAENFLKRRQKSSQVDDVLETLHPLLSAKKPVKKGTAKNKEK